ncbi:hypothetical protein L5515_018751 [Caenorhabditis briggsae]|uniref:Uncharacterized protein n=1 Tax=Caenorhabditis briggsae TaxID=6238 RepID=A0AAE9JT02_CAEBR|nr:hypothetical protein L5515_018751 [Caenorhabditis briggsae]
MNNRPKRACAVSNTNGKPPENATGANTAGRRQGSTKEAIDAGASRSNVEAALLANKNTVVAATAKNVAPNLSKTETDHEATSSKDASEHKVTKTPSRTMPARLCKSTFAEKMSGARDECASNTKDSSSSSKNTDSFGPKNAALPADGGTTSGDPLPKMSVLQPKIPKIEKSKEAAKKDSSKKKTPWKLLINWHNVFPDLDAEDFLPRSSTKPTGPTSSSVKAAVENDKKRATSSAALPSTSQKAASEGDGILSRQSTLDATKASTEAPQLVQEESSLNGKNEQMDSTSTCGTSENQGNVYTEEWRKLFPILTSQTPQRKHFSIGIGSASSSVSLKPKIPTKLPNFLIATPDFAGPSSSSLPALATPAQYTPKLLSTSNSAKQRKQRTPRNIFTLPIFDEDREDELLIARSSTRPTRYTGNFVNTAAVENDEKDEKMDEDDAASENEDDSESEETYKKPSISEQREAIIEKFRRSEKRKSIVQMKKEMKYADKISREFERSEKRRKTEQKKREDKKWREQQKELKEQERSDNALANLKIRKIAHRKAQDKKFIIGRQKSMKEVIKMLKERTIATDVQVRVPSKKFEEPNNFSISHLVPIQRFSRSGTKSEYFKQLENHYRTSPNFKAIHAFATEATKLSEKHYFGSISDPFFKAREFRCKWVDARYIGVGKQPDFGLDVSYADKMPSDWKQEIQKKLPQRFYELGAKENLPKLVEAIGSKQYKLLDLTPEFSRLDSAKKMAKVEYIVDKFLLLLKIWKIKHTDTQYPRVVLYFFFVMESVMKTVPLQSREAVIFDFVGGSNDAKYELVKNMIFWLPVHLGDLAGTCHVPQPEMIDLSRQMLAVLLNEWPVAMGMRLEDQDLLERIQLAALRLECHNSMEKDEIREWLPFFKPKNREGAEGVYSDVKEKRQNSLRRVWASRKTTVEFGRLETSHPVRPTRRRCHSFSEFKDSEKFPKKTERINLDPIEHWNMLWSSQFEGLRRIKYSVEGSDVPE